MDALPVEKLVAVSVVHAAPAADTLPAYMFPLTPAPPTTINAPVVVLVLETFAFATILPCDLMVVDVVNEVNAPDPCEDAPMEVKLPTAAPYTPIDVLLILPPTYKLPEIPAPPLTTNAPVVIPLDSVVDAATIFPVAVNVVNAPVDADVEPIGVA